MNVYRYCSAVQKIWMTTAAAVTQWLTSQEMLDARICQSWMITAAAIIQDNSTSEIFKVYCSEISLFYLCSWNLFIILWNWIIIHGSWMLESVRFNLNARIREIYQCYSFEFWVSPGNRRIIRGRWRIIRECSFVHVGYHWKDSIFSMGGGLASELAQFLDFWLL